MWLRMHWSTRKPRGIVQVIAQYRLCDRPTDRPTYGFSGIAARVERRGGPRVASEQCLMLDKARLPTRLHHPEHMMLARSLYAMYGRRGAALRCNIECSSRYTERQGDLASERVSERPNKGANRQASRSRAMLLGEYFHRLAQEACVARFL